MRNRRDINEITLIGTFEESPKLDFTGNSGNFYSATLRVERLSGAVDRVPVSIHERVLSSTKLTGSRVLIKGQIRTRNEFEGEKLKLIIYVTAFSVEDASDSDIDKNEVKLYGTIGRTPIFRTTPRGRDISDVLLIINNKNRAYYIPVIYWGGLAKRVSALRPGDTLTMTGRFQSRDYIKATESGEKTKTAYEVSASTLKIRKEGTHKYVH